MPGIVFDTHKREGSEALTQEFPPRMPGIVFDTHEGRGQRAEGRGQQQKKATTQIALRGRSE